MEIKIFNQFLPIYFKTKVIFYILINKFFMIGEKMEKIKSFFDKNDLFAKHCGICLTHVSLGEANAKMKIESFHLNGAKTVHGGAIFTLADYTFAAACNSHGNMAVALEVSISFLKAGLSGTLYAHAKEISLNKKIGVYQIDITNDRDELIASFKGTAYRKKINILET